MKGGASSLFKPVATTSSKAKAWRVEFEEAIERDGAELTVRSLLALSSERKASKKDSSGEFSISRESLWLKIIKYTYNHLSGMTSKWEVVIWTSRGFSSNKGRGTITPTITRQVYRMIVYMSHNKNKDSKWEKEIMVRMVLVENGIKRRGYRLNAKWKALFSKRLNAQANGLWKKKEIALAKRILALRNGK